MKTSLQKRGLQALGTLALTKKEEVQSRGKMLSRILGSNPFVFYFLHCLRVRKYVFIQ